LHLYDVRVEVEETEGGGKRKGEKVKGVTVKFSVLPSLLLDVMNTNDDQIHPVIQTC
jgi:hypothetical protein